MMQHDHTAYEQSIAAYSAFNEMHLLDISGVHHMHYRTLLLNANILMATTYDTDTESISVLWGHPLDRNTTARSCGETDLGRWTTDLHIELLIINLTFTGR